MLFTLGHGQHAFRDAAPASARAGIATAGGQAPAGTVPLSAVIAAPPHDASLAGARALGPDEGQFRYYFEDAAGLPEQADMPALLDALADSMVEPPFDPDDINADRAGNSRIPPVFTYLGQFIDHDITANTDRETALSVIDGAIAPLARAAVTEGLGNLRDGSLGLDSLYGDTEGQGAFAEKLKGLMRHKTLAGKMRLATPEPDGPRVPLPVLPDNATDLLRLGRLLDRGEITLVELQALDEPLRSTFLENGQPILARAIVGDGRNDENLVVAQLHVLFLRLHNKLVDATGGFEEARRLTRWHYQWLVVHAYLATICDVAVLDDVLAGEAPLYARLLQGTPAQGGKLPMPLEFSVAAFRFGHSMVRAAYDHNRVFGRAVPPTQNLIADAAPFRFHFGFTGNGRMNGQPEKKQLPDNWVIEWDRWVRIDTAHPVRSARRLDTDLAKPLSEMENEVGEAMSEATRGIFRHLARRNLRRGYRLNLPTAQECIAAVNALGGEPLPALTPEQVKAGSPARRAALEAGGFEHATPLWFYVLREAEALGCGERLGPLGSRLVAETLVGLIVADPTSYWHAPGADGDGRWSPSAFRPEDPIDGLEDVARFCGML